MRTLRIAVGAAGVALLGTGGWLLWDATGGEGPQVVGLAVALAGVAAVHDLLLVPAVLLVGLALRRPPGRGLLRGGLVVAGCLVAVALPLLLRPGAPPHPTVLPLDYPRNLLVAVAVTAAVTVVLWGWGRARDGGLSARRAVRRTTGRARPTGRRPTSRRVRRTR